MSCLGDVHQGYKILILFLSCPRADPSLMGTGGAGRRSFPKGNPNLRESQTLQPRALEPRFLF
jgi:hypothetical protein